MAGPVPAGKPLSLADPAGPLLDDDGFVVIQERTGTAARPKTRLTTLGAMRIAIAAYLTQLNNAYVAGSQLYADQRASATLTAANMYTDQKGDPAALTAAARTYAEQQDVLRLAESKIYADGRLVAAKAYADTGDQQTLAAALAQIPSTNTLAPLASPGLTGVPTAPTAPAGTNTVQIATTAYVRGEVSALVGAVPGALDTLDELAAALGDDPNFAATVTTNIGLKAPLASPALTGVPTSPTAALNTTTTQVATTAFVVNQASALNPLAAAATGVVGVSKRYSREDHQHPTDTTRAPLADAALTGNPTAPTQTTGNNSTRLATTAFVATAIAAIPAAQTGATNLDALTDVIVATPALAQTLRFNGTTWVNAALGVADVTGAAPLAGPTFTGVVQAPTPTAGDNTAKVATTAFVKTAVDAAVIGAGGGATNLDGLSDVVILTPVAAQVLRFNGTSFVNAALALADITGSNTLAPLASPTFTGVPAAPTPAAGTNTTQVATTAYVRGEVAALVNAAPAALDSLNELAAALGGDANFATTVNNSIALKAPIASPTFTGAPLSTTPATADNTTKIATTAFVKAQGYAPVASPTFTGVVTVASSALAISAGSISWDLALGGNVRTLSMTSNATLNNPSNKVAGRHYTVLVTQAGAGGFTLAYGTDYIFPGGTKPVLSTEVGAKDMLVFICDGTKMWGVDNKAFA